MSTEIALIPEDMVGTDLASLLGFTQKASNQSTLPELKQLYKAVKGEMEVKGRKMTVETIPGGYYSITLADGKTVYAENASVRIFMQRYHYQRFEKFAAPVEGKDGKMFRSVMSTSLNNGDLKDNYGGFNCGRPGGYIKDYDKLTGPVRDIVKNTKRVLVAFGLVQLINPTDENGNPVEDVGIQPFFMRIKNPKSVKAIEAVGKAAAKANRMPIHFWSLLGNDHEMLPNGEPNFFVTASLGEAAVIALEDQETIKNFLEWIEYQNRGILMMWDNAHKNDMSDEDMGIVEQFVNIGGSEEDDEIPF